MHLGTYFNFQLHELHHIKKFSIYLRKIFKELAELLMKFKVVTLCLRD